MPEVAVKLFEGRSNEQKEAFRADIVAAVIKNLSMPGAPALTEENVKFSMTEMERPKPEPALPD